MVVKTVREYMRALLKVHTLLTEEQFVTQKAYRRSIGGPVHVTVV
jgi:hypothetical protein